MGLLKPWRNKSSEETSLATGKTSCFLARTTEENRVYSHSQAMGHSQKDGGKYILARMLTEAMDSMWLRWGEV